MAKGIFTEEQGQRLIPQAIDAVVKWGPPALVALWGVWKTVAKRAKLNVMQDQPKDTPEATVETKLGKMGWIETVNKAFEPGTTK